MKRFLLFLLDIFALYLSLYLTLFFRYGFGDSLSQNLEIHLVPFSILFIFWLVAFYISSLYELAYLKNDARFYSRFFQTITVNAAFSAAFFYLIPFFGITPKTNLLIFIIIFAGLNFIFRSFYNKIISSKTFINNLVIIGLNQQSLDLAKFIKSAPQLGYRLKYIVDISKDSSADELSEFGIVRETDINRIINEEKVQTIILSPAAYKLPRLIEILYNFLNKKINFYNLSDFYEHLTGKIPLGAIDQTWFLENLTEGNKRGYEIVKRALDVFFSVVLGMIVIVLFPLLALIIKLDSRGPIFYKQKRVGQYGKPFIMIKFRTMVQDAEKAGAVWTQKKDPRVTRFGKLMRKTRLDELPQAWNILKGEMSFIGPRAERPEFHDELKKRIPFYEERYLIKPGATGWAQLQKDYYSSVADTHDKLQFDLFYIKNRSFALDLSIALKTINQVLRQAGR